MVDESIDGTVHTLRLGRARQRNHHHHGAAHARSANKSPNMHLPINHDRNIHHREPLLTYRRKRRGFPFARYNHTSPEVGAMNAHLRAAAYGGKNAVSPNNNSARSFLDLSREYDSQARSNFTREAIVFAVIAIVAIAWPFIHSMQVFAR
jgi:hypothetical protein